MKFFLIFGFTLIFNFLSSQKRIIDDFSNDYFVEINPKNEGQVLKLFAKKIAKTNFFSKCFSL